MAEPVGKPACWDFEQRDCDVAGRQDGRDCRRGDMLVLHPPEQIERVGDPLNRNDAIDGIEREIPAIRGSIGRHTRAILARVPVIIACR